MASARLTVSVLFGLMASARLTVSVPPPLPAVEKEEVEMKQWRWHDGRGRRFPGGCGDGDWLEDLSRYGGGQRARGTSLGNGDHELVALRRQNPHGNKKHAASAKSSWE